MKEIVKTSRLAGQLEKLYRLLNTDFFNDMLKTPIITIQSTTRIFGHYTLYDAWDVKGVGRREINIGAGTLDRPIEATVSTLLHEMVHQLNCEVLHVQDCSGSSHMYHNGLFRAAAETHGLICKRTDRYGWSHTEPSDALLTWILENDVPEIKLNRNEYSGIRIAGGSNAANGGTAPTTSKSHSRKYVCPVCGQSARTTKTANLVCGNCMEHMIET